MRCKVVIKGFNPFSRHDWEKAGDKIEDAAEQVGDVFKDTAEDAGKQARTAWQQQAFDAAEEAVKSGLCGTWWQWRPRGPSIRL